jgi:transaldolase
MSAHAVGAPRLYVDSADTERVGALLRSGLVHGVTTNPTILERHGHRAADLPELYRRWVEEGAREVFFQAWGEDAAELRACAERIAGLGERVAVKIPATPDGFAAAAAVVAGGTPVLLTAVYSVAQALAAASIGVAYIAPYLGRMRDAGMDADAMIPAMQAVCAGAGTNVLLASLRTPDDVVAMRLAGIGLFTAAPDVLDEMLRHEVSASSAVEFEAAMRRIGG